MKLLLALCALTLSAWAQSAAGGGTIQGTVKDPTGAVIAGAKIDIRHIETGLSSVRIANSEGYFTTPPLNIGRYKIRVKGYSIWVAGGGVDHWNFTGFGPEKTAYLYQPSYHRPNPDEVFPGRRAEPIGR